MFETKLRDLIAAAVDSLDPADREWRIQHCRETGIHGVECIIVGDSFRLVWAGLDLAVVPAEFLTNDEIPSVTDLPPELSAGWVSSAVPDHVPDEWLG
jgi:hypothetical protein